MSSKLASDLRATLMKSSLLHAYQKIPAYRERYSGFDWDNLDLEDSLLKLPSLSKREARSDPVSFLNPDLETDFLQNTSGSTGPCYFMHRSHVEQQAFERFFIKNVETQSFPNLCVLQLSSPDHGTLFQIPGPARGFDQSVINMSTLLNCVYFLKSSDDIDDPVPLINGIQGSLKGVVLLTHYLQNQNIKLKNITLDFIVVFGDYVTQRKRHFLEDYWQCPVYSRYSLSEMVGGALGRQGDGQYHYLFDLYACYELVKLDQHDQLSNDCGELLMTTPYPLIQRQPLIRYQTNDLFAIKPHPDRSEYQYIYLGRKNHSLILKEGGVFVLKIPSSAIYEALDNDGRLGGQSWCSFLPKDQQPLDLSYYTYKGTYRQSGKQIDALLKVESQDLEDKEQREKKIVDDILLEMANYGFGNEGLSLHVELVQEIPTENPYELLSQTWFEEENAYPLPLSG